MCQSSQTFVFRYEKNDNLIKLHKEILEQKCKRERATTELKRSKKSIKPFADRDFIYAFAVSNGNDMHKKIRDDSWIQQGPSNLISSVKQKKQTVI